MGLLDQLWDDTVAGPPPLAKLRKYNSFSPSSSSSSSSPTAAAAAGDTAQVTRSITMLRPTPSSSAASSPLSPSSPGSDTMSPLAHGTTGGEWKKLRRKPMPVAEGMETAEPRTPSVYDWVVISSLDR